MQCHSKLLWETSCLVFIWCGSVNGGVSCLTMTIAIIGYYCIIVCVRTLVVTILIAGQCSFIGTYTYNHKLSDDAWVKYIYCIIAGNLWERKLGKWAFHGEKPLMECQPIIIMVGVVHPKFHGENFCSWLSNHKIHIEVSPLKVSHYTVSICSV